MNGKIKAKAYYSKLSFGRGKLQEEFTADTLIDMFKLIKRHKIDTLSLCDYVFFDDDGHEFEPDFMGLHDLINFCVLNIQFKELVNTYEIRVIKRAVGVYQELEEFYRLEN